VRPSLSPNDRLTLMVDTIGRSLSPFSLLERTENPQSIIPSSLTPGRKPSRLIQTNPTSSTQTPLAFVCPVSFGHLPSCVSLPWVDRVLYGSDITAKISAEAAKPDSVFSLNDRIGLILDSVALAKAGFSDTSSMFTLINSLRGEKECMFSRL